MNQKSKVLDSGWIELILTAKRLGLTDEEIKDYLQNHSSVISFTKDAKKKRVR
ncbi:anti-repressor SinI family protein [Alkalihalobacillus deserti]|uniref:anti-repressor SinI family protein n=1 Tax=Alkalihalobacillus deserti TaxID=2879466 RepID=UPI001D141819|nr:anti-repressor SinI family protein [Alkalihalobacillus deserti]